MLKGVSAVDVLLLAHGPSCCRRFFGPGYSWNLITFDFVPIFGRDFFETVPRLKDLVVTAVEDVYSNTNFNTNSLLSVLVCAYAIVQKFYNSLTAGTTKMLLLTLQLQLL